MEVEEGDFSLLELGGDETSHPLPLAEDYDFADRVAVEEFGDYVDGFVDFDVMARLIIEDVCAVAHHSHLVERDEEAVAVGFGEEVITLPFGDELGDGRFVILVGIHLLRSHGHEENLVLTAGQLDGDVAFAAAYQTAGDSFTDFIEVAITDHLSRLILEDVTMAELIIWSEAILVDEFHDGIEFLDFTVSYTHLTLPTICSV